MAWLLPSSSASLVVAGQRFSQGALIADGGFAYVYRGSNVQSGEAVAIRRALLQDADSLNKAREEHVILECLPVHPHIVKCIGATVMFDSPPAAAGRAPSASVQQAVSVFEFCSGGTLLSKLEAALTVAGPRAAAEQSGAAPGLVPCVPESEVLKVLGGCASALSRLHALGIIHYDVKCENLLLGPDGHWKLGDFGSASRKTFELAGAQRQQLFEAEEFIHGRCTPIYRAPEAADVHLRWPIGPKVDVFALGCVLFATLTGTHPFPMDSALANIQAKYALPSQAVSVYSAAVITLLHAALLREPKLRISAGDVDKQIRNVMSTGMVPNDLPLQTSFQAPAAADQHEVVAQFDPPSFVVPEGLAVSDWVADFDQFAPVEAPAAAAVAPAVAAEPAPSPAAVASTTALAAMLAADAGAPSAAVPRAAVPSALAATTAAPSPVEAPSAAIAATTLPAPAVAAASAVRAAPVSAADAASVATLALAQEEPLPPRADLVLGSGPCGRGAAGVLQAPAPCAAAHATAKDRAEKELTFAGAAATSAQAPEATDGFASQPRRLDEVVLATATPQAQRSGRRRRAVVACFCGKVRVRD